MDIVYYRQTQFNDALAKMARSGGVPQQAARRVKEIVGALSLGVTGASELGRLTRHGESRIKHCLKMDLPGRHRLVCTHHDDVFTLLFVGSHDECERWLDQNRGITPIVDRKTGKIALVSEVSAGEPLPARDLNLEAPLDRSLLDGLSAEYLDLLPVKHALMRRLLNLKATTGDDELLECINAMPGGDQQNLVLGVLIALRDGNTDGARALLDKYAQRATSAYDEPSVMRDAIRAEINADALVNLRELSDIEIEHLFNRATFREWLTFLHPDQKRLATATFDGAAMVTGVSGSGKTSVLVHRAKHLATKHADERILILTLNRALAALIANLVEELCPLDVRSRIDAWSVNELCERVVRFYNPGQHLLTEDPRSREDLEDCWDDSFAWSEQQDTLDPILRSLRATYQVDAVRYIRDEFIWVRSGLRERSTESSLLADREAYTDPELTPRDGRSIAFSVDWRKRILSGLEHYEEWMRTGGFVDAAALSLEAHRHVGPLRQRDHPFVYRSVLVDEMQDLGSVELEIIRAIAPAQQDGLLLAGDPNQQVFPKSHNRAAAGIRIAATDRRYLRKNYRNTKQILEAGLALLESFGRTDLFSDSETKALSPELSVREGPRPLAVLTKDRSAEQTFIVQYVAEQLRLRPDAPVGIVVCGVREDNPTQLGAIQKQFIEGGLPVRLLSQDSGLLVGGVYLSALETIKGFEFGLIVITRCSGAVIPDLDTPVEERWREARRLYVAMTRGRDEVVFTYSGRPSEYLAGMGTFVQHSTVEAQGLTAR